VFTEDTEGNVIKAPELREDITPKGSCSRDQSEDNRIALTTGVSKVLSKTQQPEQDVEMTDNYVKQPGQYFFRSNKRKREDQDDIEDKHRAKILKAMLVILFKTSSGEDL